MDRYSTKIDKHLPGRHNQLDHASKAASKYSDTDDTIPVRERKGLVKRILKDLGVSHVPIVINGEAPMIDYGGGDIGQPYGIYDDENEKVDLYDEAFIYGKKVLVSMLAHETLHHLYDSAWAAKKDKYAALLDENSEFGKKLAASDGVTEYSRHYWGLLADEKARGVSHATSFEDINFDVVVNETLAEVAKVTILKDHTSQDSADYASINPIWKDLYNEIYKDGKPKKKRKP